MNKTQLKELIKKSHMKEGSTVPWLNQDKNTSEATLDALESKLKSHDWYHMMSDDNAAHIKGSAEESELKKIAKELVDSGHGDAAADMYNQYNKFKGITFDQYIAPTQPFISRFKRKQMGLGETEFSKQDDENHKHIYKQIDPDGTAECTICGLRNSDPSKTGEKVVAESTWSTGTYTEIKRFVSDLDMLKDKYYNIVGSDDVFDGLDRAATAAEELMRNAPENKGPQNPKTPCDGLANK